MQAIKAYTQIYNDFDGQKMLEKIEKVARNLLQVRRKRFRKVLLQRWLHPFIKSGHEAMLEHASVTVKLLLKGNQS